MDKKHFQNNILSASYNRVIWIEVLKEYFGIKRFHQNPTPILLSANDIADNAVELGSFDTADDRLVGIYEITLKEDATTKIAINKVGLRNLLRSVYKYDVDGALIVFIHGNKWRFSYVSEIRTEEGKKETEPKRYTYLFGKGESCRTAADRFDKLKGKPICLNDLYDAFSVEKLNEVFFKTYQEFYKEGAEYLGKNKEYYILFADTKQTDEDKKQKPIRDFVKKLLGRIVFLQFLQKKGWMGCPANSNKWENGDNFFMQKLFSNYPQKQIFHSKCLKTLFFETLNTNRKENNDLAPNSLWAGSVNGFRVPYLNGGLFDKDISYEQSIDFPVNYFERLFDFLESYNFTIDENDPYDNEVGIDPEMLGHIFENLLEENRKNGVFYTPKEIVHYMCKESLIEYIHTHLPEINRLIIESFIYNNIVSPELTRFNIANQLNELIKDIKICDPAIGSGAFPMGMLAELLECRRLLYPYLHTNLPFYPAQVKKEIIQTNIYGVDIENGAVDIARLRFWLALVVDEIEPQPLPNLDYKIMQGNSLLEKFDDIDLKFEKKRFQTKIIKDVDLFGRIINPQISITDFLQTKQNAKEFDITELEDKYFSTNNQEEKQQIRDKIETFERTFIEEQLQSKENDISILINNKQKDVAIELAAANSEFLKQKVLSGRKANDLQKLKEQLQKVQNNKIRLAEIKTHDKPYFLWHLYFMDVFDNGGFDIIIGNPPYIKEHTDKSAFEGLKDSDYYQGKMDIWYFFACRFLEYLKDNSGILTFIATNNWVTNAGASILRNKIAVDAQIISLIDFSYYKIFENADIQTMIMIFRNSSKSSHYSFDYRKIIDTETHVDDVVNILNKKENEKFLYLNPEFNRTYLSDKTFVFSNDNDSRILNLILEKGNFFIDGEKELMSGIDVLQDFVNKQSLKILGSDYNLGDGIFVLSDEEKNQYNFSELELKFIKPYYTTRELQRYYGNKDNNYWIIYTDSSFKNKTKIKDYPNIKKHLDKFSDVITSENGPYGLHRSRDEYFFKGEKILSVRKCAIPTFTYSNFDCYFSRAFFSIKTNRINQKYLAAILNSKLIAFWLKHKGKMQGFQYQVDKDPLINLPIVNLSDTSLFENLVDYVLFINENITLKINEYVPNDHIIKSFEDIINACVYELYFDEHMLENNINVFSYVKELIVPIKTEETVSHNALVINKVYSELKEPKNEVRNRMLLFATRSEDTILPIQKVY